MNKFVRIAFIATGFAGATAAVHADTIKVLTASAPQKRVAGGRARSSSAHCLTRSSYGPRTAAP